MSLIESPCRICTPIQDSILLETRINSGRDVSTVPDAPVMAVFVPPVFVSVICFFLFFLLDRYKRFDEYVDTTDSDAKGLVVVVVVVLGVRKGKDIE